MINETKVKRYCKDPIEKIENYDKAIADKTQTWHLHHRLEFTLDGEFAHSIEELKRLKMYYNRPYFELVFLTPAEHTRLHKTGKSFSESHKANLSAAKTGKTHSDKTKKKISEALSGKSLSESHKAKISAALSGENNPWFGKTLSVEAKKKISENSAEPMIAKEYKEYKKNDGILTYNDWKHERTIRLREQWQKYRDEGGVLPYKRWYKLNHTPT